MHDIVVSQLTETGTAIEDAFGKHEDIEDLVAETKKRRNSARLSIRCGLHSFNRKTSWRHWSLL